MKRIYKFITSVLILIMCSIQRVGASSIDNSTKNNIETKVSFKQINFFRIETEDVFLYFPRPCPEKDIIDNKYDISNLPSSYLEGHMTNVFDAGLMVALIRAGKIIEEGENRFETNSIIEKFKTKAYEGTLFSIRPGEDYVIVEMEPRKLYDRKISINIVEDDIYISDLLSTMIRENVRKSGLKPIGSGENYRSLSPMAAIIIINNKKEDEEFSESKEKNNVLKMDEAMFYYRRAIISGRLRALEK